MNKQDKLEHEAQLKYPDMKNRAMARKLTSGEALDVSAYNRMGDWYVLVGVEEKDYCDAEAEAWIWSIGRNLKTGEICASTTAEFYTKPGWECVWLR